MDAGGGINLVPGVWEPPANPTAEELAAARLWMQAYDAKPDPVSDASLRKWLMTFLGNLAVNSGNGEAEIEMRVKLLSVAVDERDTRHFTKESLKLAWQRFKFVPSAHELMAFFDELESLERCQAQRLMAVLDAGAKPPTAKAAAMDVDESMRRHREKQDRERRELVAILAERDAAAGKYAADASTPARAPGESDRAYGIRLADHCRGQIAAGELALKRDNRMRAQALKAATRTAYQETGGKVEPAAAEPAAAEVPT